MTTLPLTQKMLQLPLRETSGAMASNRFDYQKDWTICKLLELQSKDDDYVVICEFHEDVIVLNSSISPSVIDFCQVKTKKRGTWTTTQLCRRSKGKNDDLTSIMGRLYAVFDQFKDYDANLYFVTNASFKIKLSSNPTSTTASLEYDKIPLNLFSQSECTAVKTKLKEELGWANSDVDTNFNAPNLVLLKTNMPIDDRRKWVIGSLTEFFEENFPDKQVRKIPFYRTLFDTIKERTDCERGASIQSFQDLKSSKGISRSDFEQMLNKAVNARDRRSEWPVLQSYLTGEHVPFMEVLTMKRHFDRMNLLLMNRSNSVLLELKRKVVLSVRERMVNNKDPTMSLVDVIDLCTSECYLASSVFDERDTRALVMIEILVHIDQPPSAHE